MSILDTPILQAKSRSRSRSNSKSHSERLLTHVKTGNDADDYTPYTGYEERIVWTVADQLKLMALDHLQRRMLEYHNNIHVKGEEVLGVLSKNNRFDPRNDLDNRSDRSDKSDKSFRYSLNLKVVQQNRMKVSDYLSGKEKENSSASIKSPIFGEGADLEDNKTKHVAPSANDKVISNLLTAALGIDENVMNEYGVIVVQFFPGFESFPQRLKRDEFENVVKSIDSRKKEAKHESNIISSIQSSSSTNSNSSSSSSSCCSSNINNNNRGFVWFHITDISFLGFLSHYFKIHELCLAAFYDYRANSSFISTSTSCVFSFCAFHLNMMDAELNKLIIYCQEGLIVTFESSIMLDINDLSNAEEDHQQSSYLGKGTDLPPQHAESGSGISEGVVFDRIIEKLYKISGKAKELGTMYVAYQLALECLYIQDTLVEFLSRSCSYVKQEIGTKLTYQQKLELLHKMQSILNSSHLLHHNNAKYQKILRILMEAIDKNINSGKIAASLNTYLVTDDHFAYIQDLVESFEFSDDCIQALVEALKESRIALDSVINLRTSNTSIFLSLVATTFLPLTFFAGVFGMNFSTSGDYSITILNNPLGPNIFIAICVGSVVFILGYFISQGWLELFTPKWISKLLKIQAYSKEDIEREISMKEIEEAKREETKRNQKSQLLKSLRSKQKTHRESMARGRSPLARASTGNTNDI